VRDNFGAVRVFDFGDVPMPEDIRAFHHDKISERAKAERREASFDMVIDDVRAISASKLIGRPEAA
jgi:methylaspartate mutase epsilon subunit